jgi:hypothetical protein
MPHQRPKLQNLRMQILVRHEPHAVPLAPERLSAGAIR